MGTAVGDAVGVAVGPTEGMAEGNTLGKPVNMTKQYSYLANEISFPNATNTIPATSLLSLSDTLSKSVITVYEQETLSYDNYG